MDRAAFLFLRDGESGRKNDVFACAKVMLFASLIMMLLPMVAMMWCLPTTPLGVTSFTQYTSLPKATSLARKGKHRSADLLYRRSPCAGAPCTPKPFWGRKKKTKIAERFLAFPFGVNEQKQLIIVFAKCLTEIRRNEANLWFARISTIFQEAR